MDLLEQKQELESKLAEANQARNQAEVKLGEAVAFRTKIIGALEWVNSLIETETRARREKEGDGGALPKEPLTQA